MVVRARLASGDNADPGGAVVAAAEPKDAAAPPVPEAGAAAGAGGADPATAAGPATAVDDADAADEDADADAAEDDTADAADAVDASFVATEMRRCGLDPGDNAAEALVGEGCIGRRSTTAPPDPADAVTAAPPAPGFDPAAGAEGGCVVRKEKTDDPLAAPVPDPADPAETELGLAATVCI